MKLSFGASFADALRIWRGDSTLLLPLAGMTTFLPQYAVLLLVPPLSKTLPATLTIKGEADPAAVQATADAMSAWLTSYGGWYLLAQLLGLFGGLAVIALYCTPGRPTLSRALARAAALFLRYLLASILIGFVAISFLLPGALSTVLLAVLMPPAFYLLGRTMLTGPAIVGDAPIGAVAAIQRSWALTRGNGWLLGATYAAPLFGAHLIGGALLSLGALGGENPVVTAIVDGLAALVLAATALTLALVEVALYRRLASTGT